MIWRVARIIGSARIVIPSIRVRKANATVAICGIAKAVGLLTQKQKRVVRIGGFAIYAAK